MASNNKYGHLNKEVRYKYDDPAYNNLKVVIGKNNNIFLEGIIASIEGR